MFKDKKGFIRIVEAGVAILILLAFLSFVFAPSYVGKNTVEKEIFSSLDSILNEIELREDFREAIFENGNSLVDEFVREELSAYNLDGRIIISDINEVKIPQDMPDNKDIFVRERLFAKSYNEIKRVSIFAWRKG